MTVFRSISAVILTFVTLALTTPIAAGSTLTFVVIASGQAFQGNPVLHLDINGRQIAHFTITATHAVGDWQKIAYTEQTSAELRNFGVGFLNDFETDSGDRNLFVKSISVNGAEMSLSKATLTKPNGARLSRDEYREAYQGELNQASVLTWSASLLAVAGVCGGASDVAAAVAPSLNLCTTGTASTVSKSGTWSWNCAGLNGGSAVSCTAPLAAQACIDAGGASHPSGSFYVLKVSSTPQTRQASSTQCPYGGIQPTTITVNQSYFCSYGAQSPKGSPVSTTIDSGSPICNAPASCGTHASGSSYSVQVSSIPGVRQVTPGQCPYGGTQPIVTTVNQSYICSNGTQTADGSSVSAFVATGNPICKAAPVNGMCGASNSASLISTPSTGLCSAGTASGVAGSGPWSWSCSGSNNGSTAFCATSNKAALTIPVISAPPSSPTATNYYVSNSLGNDNNSGLGVGNPVATIGHALDLSRGGDIIMVMGGSYNEAVKLNKGGSLLGYTLLMGMQGYQRPVIAFNNPNPNTENDGESAINILTSYVRVSGFDLHANGIYDSGLGVWSTAVTKNNINYSNTHHIFIDNNVVHDNNGGGIVVTGSDYVTVAYNVAYNNANLAPNGTSGISVGYAIDYDSAPSYHNIVVNNLAYNNINLVGSNFSTPNGRSVVTACTTDGNGIIIDDNNRDQIDNIPAKAATLILGNISLSNGGRGIVVNKSANVTVVNNTVLFNLKDPQMCHPQQQGELEVDFGNNVNFYNNISVSAGTAQAIEVYGLQGGTVQNNITYGNSVNFGSTNVVPDASNMIGVDPLLISPSTNPLTANLRLQSGSAAIAAGVPFTTPQVDLAGDTVPANQAINLGAYFR